MSHIPEQPNSQTPNQAASAAEKVTPPLLQSYKQQGRKAVMLTAYDYPTARLADEAGVDMILVGDSLANTALGYDSTIPVTLDEMMVATRAVRRGVKRALVVADMPFGTYQTSGDDAMRAALRFVKEAGAEAIKLEGGRQRLALVRQMVENGIPVMGHIGLTPQSVLQMGGYKLQGKTLAAARAIMDDALALESAGAFAVVLEVVPASLARAVTWRLKIPTVGIGAGGGTDAQVLVINDLLGLTFGKSAKFVRRYADLKTTVSDAIRQYADDVRQLNYPSEQESYDVPREAAERLERLGVEADDRDEGFVIYSH
jgi:3-methyl-2-oxobutanoate hydroxymethyltransferase